MNQLDSPFAALDSLLDGAAEEGCRCASSTFLRDHQREERDGVVPRWARHGRGRHPTHVPTADARLLPKGTAYISDVGMTGPRDSIIGFSLETVLPRFLTHLPTRFAVAEGPVSFNAVVIEAERASGRATSITQLQRLVEV